MVDITWALALISVGLIAILGSQIAKTKKKTRMMALWIGIPMIAVAVLGMFSIVPQLAGLNNPIQLGGLAVAPGEVDIADQLGEIGTGLCPVTGFVRIDGVCQCIGVEDTTVRLSGINKYNQSAVGGNHRYRLNGDPALTVSDAGTFTASPGDAIEILWMNAVTSGRYFADVTSDIVPCSGTKTFSRELVYNSTATIRVFNEDGNAITGTFANSAINETMAAGEVTTLPIDIIAVFQAGFPHGGVVVAEWNDTTIDDVIIELGGSEVSVPSAYSINYSADSKSTAYSIPAFETTNRLVGEIVLDADDTTGPRARSGEKIILTFYTNNYFINEDEGGKYDGPAVEDEDDAVTYGHVTRFFIGLA